MSEDKQRAVLKQIVDALSHAQARSQRCLVVVRCVGAAEVDHARQALMSVKARFPWRSLPVAELDPPDLVGVALRAAAPNAPALAAYDLPKGIDGRLLNAFVERLKVAERRYVMGPYRMVLLLTLAEMRELNERAKSFWKSRDLFVAWPARAGSSAYLPATTRGAMPTARGGKVGKAGGGVSGIFGNPMMDSSGVSAESNMPANAPWAGAPFGADDEDIPEYIADAAPPAGRRWGRDVAPDDAEGADLIDRCRALLDQRHTEYARQGLAKAAKRFRAASNGPATAECYVMLGRASELRFDHQVALEWYDQALQVFESLGDMGGVSDCCAMVGYLRFMHGDLDGAFSFFDRALRSDEEAGDELRMAAGYRRVGIILEERGELRQALGLYERAADIESSNKDRFAYARSLHHQARICQRQDLFDDAADLLQESLDIKEELDDEAGLATGYHELGNLRLKERELEDALEAYERALEIEEQLRDAQGIAVTQAQLGLVHRELFHFGDSTRAFAIAKGLFHRLQSPYETAMEVAIKKSKEMLDGSEFNKMVADGKAYVEQLLTET